MSIVLQVVGWVVIALAVIFAVQAVDQVQSFGISLRNPILVTAIGTAAAMVMVGILFIAFGTAIRLLREIRENTDRLA